MTEPNHHQLDSDSAPTFDVGDVVRVRDESVVSAVVLPTDGKPECVPDGLPDVGLCCVPIALVRTPPTEDGVLRWVEISDLTRIDDDAAESADGVL